MEVKTEIVGNRDMTSLTGNALTWSLHWLKLWISLDLSMVENIGIM